MDEKKPQGYSMKLDEPYEGRILAPLGATMARFSLDDAARDVADREYRDIAEMLKKANSQPELVEALARFVALRDAGYMIGPDDGPRAEHAIKVARSLLARCGGA